MKKLFLFFLGLLPTLLFSQNIYWEKNLNGRAVALAINNNNNIGYVINSHLDSQIGMLDSSSNMVWSHTFNGWIDPPAFTSNLENNNYYLGKNDSISVFNENGTRIHRFRMPTEATEPTLLLASDKDHYLAVDGSRSSIIKRLALYDYSNSLIACWPTLDKVHYKATLKGNRICLSSWQYGGGFYTNVHGYIAMYNLSGQVLWTDSLPDCINNFNCIDDAENTYYVSEYLDYTIPLNPSMGLRIRKYDPNGTILWEKSWDGDNNKQGLVIPYSITHIPGGDRGFIVGGAVTRPESIGGDINEAQGFILRVDKDGNIVWKYKKDIDAVNRYFAGYFELTWDKDNYLTAFYCESDRTPGNEMNNFAQIIKYSIDGVTSVERENSEIPTDFSLSQNYPNPFNPTTTISFSVPTSGQVSLKIYDLLGREVSTLVNEELSAGVYNTKFDASQLSSGIYVYRLTAPNFISSKKMMLVK
ncbi:MAG: T9SS type A sorting domain-containing protein [Patescibacteria group bacterium]|jgi:hypothetical protein